MVVGDSSSDAQLVAALTAGQREGLEQIYDRYSDRLYTYAITLVHSPDAAADAVADTFLLARARIDQLRDPQRLRPWLYAICRNECLHYHRSAARSAPLEEAGDVAALMEDHDSELASAAAANLVTAALPGLNDGDREVIELAMRHDFDTTSVGEALGLPTNNASARVSRAKASLQRCVGALVLFRSRGRNCAELARILATVGNFDALTRKRVARHIDNCSECERVKKAAVLEIAMASALPMLAAPAHLRERLIAASSAATEQVLVQAQALDASRPPFDQGGWPRPGPHRGRQFATMAAASGVALVALVLVSANGLAEVPVGSTPTPISVTTSYAPVEGGTLATPLASPGATDGQLPAVTRATDPSTTIEPPTELSVDEPANPGPPDLPHTPSQDDPDLADPADQNPAAPPPPDEATPTWSKPSDPPTYAPPKWTPPTYSPPKDLPPPKPYGPPKDAIPTPG